VSSTAAPDWVTRTLAGLSLDQKIGQLLFLHDSDRVAVSGGWTDTVVRLVTSGRAGGIYPGPLQLRSPRQSAELNNRLQLLAPVPLLVSADLEAGLGYVMREGATDFPMQLGLGATRSAELVSQVAAVVAREASAVGINTYFGPVLDVNVNPRNPIIATRSFGESVELVTSLGLASLESAQRGGLLCCVKHFPGHGDTDVDSHRAMPTSLHSWERLVSVELAPFQAAFDRGARGVGSAHIAFPAVDPSAAPATISPAIMTDLLRRRMGFRGLVISDAMSMRAITQSYAPGEAAVLAFLAGCDMVLTIYGEEAYAGLSSAARDGRIPEDRIDESVQRVLLAKARSGLAAAARLVDLDAVDSRVGTPENLALAQEAARRAVVLLARGGLPLSRDPSSLAIVAQHPPANFRSPVASLVQAVRSRAPRAAVAELGAIPSEGELNEARERAASADTIVVAPVARVMADRPESGTVATGVVELIRQLSSDGKPVIVLVLGSPYILAQVLAPVAALCTHGDSAPGVEAGVAAIFGEFTPTGRLSATIPGLYPYGHGL
jgi:beta-N-acetylhexosaminidase